VRGIPPRLVLVSGELFQIARSRLPLIHSGHVINLRQTFFLELLKILFSVGLGSAIIPLRRSGLRQFSHLSVLAFTEEPAVLTQSILLPSLTLLCCGIGFVGIICCRCARRPSIACWGQRFFLLALLGLGASGLIAASLLHQGLVYLGLSVGALLIAMVWEVPVARVEEPRELPGLIVRGSALNFPRDS
jgi:hypothetical protein